MVRLSALGSGSKGNALVLSCGDGSIIVDVGFSRKETCCRLRTLGLNAEEIKAALLTHEHDDHSKGCRVFCDEFDIPLCTSSLTANFLRKKGKLPVRVLEFEPGREFQIGGFGVEPFAVQHDAVNPVGFVIRREGLKIGIATDLGDINMLAMQRLSDCDALVLESNYDAQMLRDSDRQLYLKRRILGRHGHLDNMAACAALDYLLTPRTQLLLLAHLSSECNSIEIVRPLFERRLAELGRTDIEFGIIEQDHPLGTFELEPELPALKAGC